MSDDYHDGYGCGWDEGYDIGYGIGLKRGAKSAPDWISVEDRLPEPHRVVLTHHKHLLEQYSIRKQWIVKNVVVDGDMWWRGGDADCQVCHGAVTHWMPLPEGPK